MRYLVLLILVLWSTVLLSQKEAYKIGDGFNFGNSNHNVKISGRVQALSYSVFEEDSSFNDAEYGILIRRARFKLTSSHFNKLIETKFEFGLSPRDMAVPDNVHFTFLDRIVYDAIIKINPFKNFSIWIGQTKLPGNRQRIVSSANMELVDRSILNSRLNLDRDLGVQLHYKWATKNKVVVKHAFALSQGEGKNIILGNRGGLNYTFRTEVLPFGEFTSKGDYVESDLLRTETLKLGLSGSYDFNIKASRTRGQKGDYIVFDDVYYSPLNIHTFFIDGMLKYKGFSLLFETGFRLWKNEVKTTISSASSFHIQPGYTFKNNWNISARVAYFQEVLSGIQNSLQEYRLGVSKYFVGHKLKLQTDFGILNNPDNYSFVARLQAEFHF